MKEQSFDLLMQMVYKQQTKKEKVRNSGVFL